MVARKGYAMSLGPIELLIVKFPGNQFRGELAPALADLIEAGTIRVVDLVFIQKSSDGSIDAIELADLEGDVASAFSSLVEIADGMLSDDDIIELGGLLENNSSAALMIFENTWAARFADALRRANAELLFNERIPRSVVEAVLAEA
jgi:hypothetical protein